MQKMEHSFTSYVQELKWYEFKIFKNTICSFEIRKKKILSYKKLYKLHYSLYNLDIEMSPKSFINLEKEHLLVWILPHKYITVFLSLFEPDPWSQTLSVWGLVVSNGHLCFIIILNQHN